MKPPPKALNSRPDRARIAAVPANNRSRISNGSRVAAGIDLRSASGRRWRDLFCGFMDETGGKHEHLCKQAATLIMQREHLDAAVAGGEFVDSFDLVRVAGAINRTLAKLGIVADEPELLPADAPAWAVGPRVEAGGAS